MRSMRQLQGVAKYAIGCSLDGARSLSTMSKGTDSTYPGYRYHFVTTTCAIIGGVFTVAGIVDGLVHTGARFAKKVELGKHT